MTYPACPLLERFQATLDRHPAAPAMTDPDGITTYRQLWEHAVSWRDRLLGLALPGHAPVAVQSNGSSALVPAFLGTRAAGFVPLLVDTLIPPGRRDEMIRLSRAAAILDA